MYKTLIKHNSCNTQPFHMNFISDQSARIDLQDYTPKTENYATRKYDLLKSSFWILVIQGLAIMQIHSWSLVMKLDDWIEAWNNLDLAQIWTSMLVFLSLHHTNFGQMLQSKAWSIPNDAERTTICKKIKGLCGRNWSFKVEQKWRELEFWSRKWWIPTILLGLCLYTMC